MPIISPMEFSMRSSSGLNTWGLKLKTKKTPNIFSLPLMGVHA